MSTVNLLHESCRGKCKRGEARRQNQGGASMSNSMGDRPERGTSKRAATMEKKGGGGRVGAGGGRAGAGARSARARFGAAGKVCACVGENRERQNRAPICCVDVYTINLSSSRD